jgi:hypothetical protein
MANARFFNSASYGQFEPHNCAFMRDGRIEAQCSVGSAFSSDLPLENGMLVAVDKVAGEIDLADVTEVRPIGIVYTAEKIYDQFNPGLKNFKMIDSTGFYPRIGYLSVGDKFSTNCIAADTTVYATETALISALEAVASTKMYGTYTTDLGAIAVSTTKPTAGPVLSVVKKTTLADGNVAVKFIVVG